MRAVTLLLLMLAGMMLVGAQPPARQPGTPRDNPAQKTGTAQLSGVEPGEETDPDRLEKWKAIGTRVTLAEGEAKSVTLKLTR